MDIEFVRSQFPALEKEFTFMDNAGGSQTLKKVAERISGYLLHHNVQLGASYKVSREAGEKLNYATKQVSRFINAGKPEEVVIGPSSSMLLRILSICISKQWQEGDEVIVTNTDHEANVSPWTDLKEKGINIKVWKANPDSLELEISDLKKLLNKRTKLVAVTHASNILGSINPIKEIAKTVHKAGALICVDGVAYAPHRRVDVRKLDVDFYVFSWYKTYGPHLAVMYGRYNQLYQMEGFNHYFFTKKDVPYKFQPGNFNFELTYSLLGIIEYFDQLFKHEFPKEKKTDFQEKLDKIFELIGRHEERISKPLISYLNEHPKIKIIGQNTAEREKRVPTISFVHNELTSDQIVEKVDDFRIGIRFGDFYAKKLIEDAGLKEKNGVVRVSLVHYNTLDEVQRLIWTLKKVI
ncbi:MULTISPECIES: cysteine desulfurase-like protein [Salegentibacter]|jgi:cysteine desulfurase family protein (TIGR01976 family)|uniref:Cysteine desulfurase family protein, VC1184 subfamily n=1 Tax=Salegentibacter agarivorans TaxID=345907 RepID=A0A1I2MAZ0_9FLAO|nr:MULTISPECIES: cysteine desulfurase-like protein [Salegentibacter]APS38008.1 aminotransferase [Salegentibacter sp. T436]SFF87979.1 cysteine desulfurase family protein, VC1184 subfamily [Salegentibacter agarivorans]